MNIICCKGEGSEEDLVREEKFRVGACTMSHIVCNCMFIVSSDQLLQTQLEIKCYKVNGKRWKVGSHQDSNPEPLTRGASVLTTEL